MDLKEILWQNWQRWGSEGFDEISLQELCTKEDADVLLQWFHQGRSSVNGARTVKKAVDLASWCLYGTDTLLLLPLEIRIRTLSEAAEFFGIETSYFNQLMISSSKQLPHY